jgi:hypothetical protein
MQREQLHSTCVVFPHHETVLRDLTRAELRVLPILLARVVKRVKFFPFAGHDGVELLFASRVVALQVAFETGFFT